MYTIEDIAPSANGTTVAHADRAIRWTTTLSVVALAVIAAIVSYKHMYLLVCRYGEASWTAALLPISVDGMIATSSMALLADSRLGRRGGILPWALLIIGSAASLSANVAVAEPTLIGRVISAWPSLSLIGSYELLMRGIRHSTRPPMEPHLTSEVPQMVNIALGRPSEVPQIDGEPLRPGTDPAQEFRDSPANSPKGPVSALQREAWTWASTNRSPSGDLPTGKDIAAQFGRRERWGRLVKQAGLAGYL